jgi:ComF family protein
MSLMEFNSAAARMIVLYKDHNERRLADVFAELLYEALPPSWAVWAQAVTFVPADAEALVRRGFDHMEYIAEKFAGLSSLPLARLLYKHPVFDQRSLNREQRRRNLEGALVFEHAYRDVPKRVILLDDVFTTGATLDVAAKALRWGGVLEVRTFSIARVW